VKSKPLILISPSVDRKGAEFEDVSCSVSDRYSRAVVAAGGIPWVFPCLAEEAAVVEAVCRCDGVMLTGGDDVQPKLFTGDLPFRLKRTVSPVDPRRDLSDLLLVREVFRQRRPLLAICRGQQLLNVALGGTLIVDITSQVSGALRHNRSDRKDKVVHKVALTPDSILTKIAGKQTLGVNSSHHQAVGRVATLLRVTAVSTDGVIEALELTGPARRLLPWMLAVQFHPERLFERHDEFLELFRSFTRACKPERKGSE
jgi:putative glutamine amidotransferase